MKKKITVKEIFDLFGETLLRYNHVSNQYELYGRITSIYSLGNYKYLYIFYNKSRKFPNNAFVQRTEDVFPWLSDSFY